MTAIAPIVDFGGVEEIPPDDSGIFSAAELPATAAHGAGRFSVHVPGHTNLVLHDFTVDPPLRDYEQIMKVVNGFQSQLQALTKSVNEAFNGNLHGLVLFGTAVDVSAIADGFLGDIQASLAGNNGVFSTAMAAFTDLHLPLAKKPSQPSLQQPATENSTSARAVDHFSVIPGPPATFLADAATLAAGSSQTLAATTSLPNPNFTLGAKNTFNGQNALSPNSQVPNSCSPLEIPNILIGMPNSQIPNPQQSHLQTLNPKLITLIPKSLIPPIPNYKP